MDFMDKVENFFLHSEVSDKLDEINKKVIDTAFVVNEALGPAGSDAIEVLQNVYPYAEQAIATPNSEIKDRFKSLGEAMGKSVEISGSSGLQTEIEAKLSPVWEEQSYGK